MNKLWEKIKNMARPRVLRTKDGAEITLKNATPEVAAAVEKALGGGGNTVGVAEEEVAPPTPATKGEHPLVSPGIGVYQDPLSLDWHVVQIRFSHKSGEAKVVDDKNYGRDRAYATERFRIQAVNEGLVG